mmetsp:Transcript_76402/g.68515  ORF Transcript_76402/g.68515 Transcript_76402/m.68515 type:complete len:91 (-) Transcript_76402:31-303(-)|eukprot:CAMPEP_0201581372 /NCGR_PEP_ID=MMETSP0190_2-20130828/66863_1 /ASSEMBLY_ACC=CAM_ASM_000263 /TAXON_ID=37353 /ORGANISM="Rosalina sp." /LENGTH=90 /DNA_ID=CAMNT_0048019151 /DNA_START=60 /DNA_END=332 /DNA_ORIENTATION=+
MTYPWQSSTIVHDEGPSIVVPVSTIVVEVNKNNSQWKENQDNKHWNYINKARQQRDNNSAGSGVIEDEQGGDKAVQNKDNNNNEDDNSTE